MQEVTLPQDTEASAVSWEMVCGVENRRGEPAVAAVVEGGASVLVVVAVVLGVADDPPQPVRATAIAAQASHRTVVAGRTSTHLLTNDPSLVMEPLYEDPGAELVHPGGGTHGVHLTGVATRLCPGR